MRKKLWDVYFQNIHPVFPILDHAEIVQAIKSKSGASQISLLLFHSIILVVQLFLGMDNNDRRKRDALHLIFEKARVLYDLGIENDQMANMQSTLLMTLYPQAPNSHKGQAYWLSQAVSIAFTLGLQREPTQRDFSMRCRSVRKQLWWCLYIRERMTVLDLGLPSLIDELGHDVQMLTSDDFILAPLQLSLDEQSFGGFASESENIQRQLGLLFIEKAKLAIILSRLPTISTTSYEWGDRSVKTQWPRFQGQPPDLNLLRETAKKLKQWRAGLPLEVLSNRWRLVNNGSKGKDSRTITPLYKHCAMLFLTYRLAVHHLASLRWLTVNCLSTESSENAARSLRDATLEVIYIGQELLGRQTKGYVGFLQPSIIRPLLLSVVLNERSPNLMSTDITNSFHSVLQKIGNRDPFYLQAYSYLECGIIGSGASRPPHSPVSDYSMGSTESEPPSFPNVFDAILGYMDMNIDALEPQFPNLSRATDSANGVNSLGSPFIVEEINEDEVFKVFFL